MVGHDVIGVAGPAERADVGTVVVAVTATPSTSITVGVRVRVASEGLVLAPHGVVVEVHDETVFVAVDDDVGAMVAHAALVGTASLLFVP